MTEQASSIAREIELDGRGLEPPGPMMMALEAVEQLGVGDVLRFRSDRRPMLLYDRLLERGCFAETNPEPDGSCLTIIRRCRQPGSP